MPEPAVPDLDQQLPLPLAGPVRRRARPSSARPPAADLPVAQVALLTPMPHLDRLFDYEVPEALTAAAVPGTRVRVRLAGRLVDGFVLARAAASEREGLQPIRSVHGPPVLTPEVAALCRQVADRYAGSLADVLRAAVPPRHARVEAALGRALGRPIAPLTAGSSGSALAPEHGRHPEHGEHGAPGAADSARGAWGRYDGGAALLEGLGDGQPRRALWLSAPGEAWAQRLAELVAAVRARGRGVIVVAPNERDVRAINAGLAHLPNVVRLSAELGPEARYRAFLRILVGEARVVVGTRAAVFAPVVDLGAIVVWDDGDESLAEPHAPGWHAREVAALRSAAAPVSLVLAGPSATLEGARMAASGWLHVVALPRPALRMAMPRVQVAADVGRAADQQPGDRIPAAAMAILRAAIRDGPVLVGVPRTGYLPVVACQSCREQARCPQCTRPMRADGPERRPACPQHGAPPAWRCPVCGGEQLRAVVVGVRRTAEEFGRALPGTTVLTASGESPVQALPERPCLVVATPGAEPDPGPDGYAALVLLDVAAALSRPGLRTAEEVLRRWFAAASLVRPAAKGGQVLVAGEPEGREVQALIRWDPLGYAHRELEERRGLHLPPAVRTAQLVGAALPAGELVEAVRGAVGRQLLRCSGPLPVPPAARQGTEQVGWLLAVSIADGPLLTEALQRAQAQRSARGAPVVSARMDPVQLR
ncbi:MAG TPA: primosome assembly protein PriA [Candidatus Nanopelagicales bacterium]